MKYRPINKNMVRCQPKFENLKKLEIFVNKKIPVGNQVLNNSNEKLKYTVIKFCYLSCFSHDLDGHSDSVMTIYLTIFSFFFICSCS